MEDVAVSVRTEDPAAPPLRWHGLLRHAPGWRLTRRGWLAVALGALIALAVFLRLVYPFLAVHAPVSAEVLVVEGWASDYAIRAAATEFERGGYVKVYVTGGPMERGAPLAEYETYAALGAAVLQYFGVPTNRVQAVPAPRVRRDRTYASALALKDWLASHQQSVEALNLVTIGPHARRSRWLYEKAFDDPCVVGVIPVAPEDYEPHRWWAYSAGVRTVLSETAAYLYARFLFPFTADRRADPEKRGESE
jgi:hypothetical protein